MNLSFLATLFLIFSVVFSGILSTLSVEVGIFSVCLVLGALTDGPASFMTPGGVTHF